MWRQPALWMDNGGSVLLLNAQHGILLCSCFTSLLSITVHLGQDTHLCSMGVSSTQDEQGSVSQAQSSAKAVAVGPGTSLDELTQLSILVGGSLQQPSGNPQTRTVRQARRQGQVRIRGTWQSISQVSQYVEAEAGQKRREGRREVRMQGLC